MVFLREHNRICDRLRAQGLTNDEEIYQKARKEVGALIQAITYYLGRPVNNFAQITSNTAVAGGLRSLYGNVNDIDLWVGLLAEDLLPGKSVGPTMHAMLKVQFERLRDGDFYYFRNDPALPNNLRDQISNTRLSDVIRRNTAITSLQANVFVTVPCPGENGEGARVATVDEIDEMTVTIALNPVQDVLNMELDGRAENRLLRVVDLNGKIVQQTEAAPGQTQVSLPVEKLRSGMLYLLKVSGEKQMKSVRFLKN